METEPEPGGPPPPLTPPTRPASSTTMRKGQAASKIKPFDNKSRKIYTVLLDTNMHLILTMFSVLFLKLIYCAPSGYAAFIFHQSLSNVRFWRKFHVTIQ